MIFSRRKVDKEGLRANLIADLLLLTLLFRVGIAPSAMSMDYHQSTDVHLVLETTRVKYRYGEPIEVTAFLENSSPNKTYYVGRHLSSLFSTSPTNYIELKVYDSRGKEIPFKRLASDRIVVEVEGQPAKPYDLGQDYIELAPGSIYGTRQRLKLQLKLGAYELRATYHELRAASRRTDNESLIIPIWTQTLLSNVTKISVIP